MEIRQITEDKDNYLEMQKNCAACSSVNAPDCRSAGEYDPAVSG